MKYNLILPISIVLLLEYSTRIFSLKYVKKEGIKWIGNDEGSLLVNDLLTYKEEIDSQIRSFKEDEALPNQVDFQLQELSGLVNILKDTQVEQKRRLFNFSTSLEQTKLSLFKMLSEYENRIAQLEYIIMEIKKYDPFIEKFTYPISKYWLKIDFTSYKSLWKYKKNKNYITLIQAIDIINLRKPSTILLLKHHKLIEGYINVDVLQKFFPASDMKQSSAGIIFDFVNVQNFRFIELAFINSQAVVTVNDVSNDVYKKCASIVVLSFDYIQPVNVECEIISRSVEADSREYNSLTCELTSKKINVFLNYKKIIEIYVTSERRGTSSSANTAVGLFTKIGTAEFKNILTGNINFEKALKHKLKDSNDMDISKGSLHSSYRFSKKGTRDDLSVYEIPYSYKDYDSNKADQEEHQVNNVYPVPDSTSYYYSDPSDEIRTNMDDKKKVSAKKEQQQMCNNYNNYNFNLNDWMDINNTPGSWRIINQHGISRIVFNDNYKLSLLRSSFIYKYSFCNSIHLSAYIKLENNTEAGLLFRYDNKDNMYMLTISTTNKEIILKKNKNNTETIIMREYIKNINSFQRHHLLIKDEGEKGIITVYLDAEKIFSINNEPYYKSGLVGIYVEYGYGTFDTFKIERDQK
ncbi:conserved Plasmodium protein, unknown function [Plasmodium malariae]|uniref:Uncharacterized protein n=1 Tax=Plasmodium malariae TaxID=5858 RepID=A0A1C3L2I8_PLAMA|nr:conserved Plasmodium protein, unknown function [Plasmodium malariae]